MAGIYVHIPFCKQKCTYCDFASYPKETGKAEAYFACLYKEIKYRGQALNDKRFDTVYFGGGTPSFVHEKFILGAMRQIKKYFKLSGEAENTIEINPGTLTKDKLEIYKTAGFNRFSVGLQCANDRILQDVNRIHTTEDFITAAKLLKGENFSVDVMMGLPEETFEDVIKSVDLAINYGAKHISLYALKAEEGTIMYSRYLNGDLPDEDEVAEIYEKTVQYLKDRGYLRYEVSNFSLPGCESKHNLNYWQRGEYIGLGVSASSFINERRFTNTESIDEYVHLLLHGKYAEIVSEEIKGDERSFEYIMLALRTSRGVVLSEYKTVFGVDFTLRFKDKIQRLMKYLDIDAERIRIKDEYLYVQNNIIIQFME
ncbi:MAG: radical SAM family heme chaperone HemW [Christensenellaceae bacterium]